MSQKTNLQILQLLGECAAMEIDDVAKVEYPKGENPACLFLKMQNGQVFAVFAVEL